MAACWPPLVVSVISSLLGLFGSTTILWARLSQLLLRIPPGSTAPALNPQRPKARVHRGVKTDLHQILLRGRQGCLGGLLPGPAAKLLAHPRVHTGDDPLNVRQATTSTPRCSSVRRKPSGLPMPQNAATGRPRSASTAICMFGCISSTAAARDGLDERARAARAVRPRANLRIASGRHLGSQRGQQHAASARFSPPTGSLSRPRAAQVAVPPGLVESISTRSRSRRSLRCWKPSSRTRTSLSNSSHSDAGQGCAIRPLQMRHIGRFCSSTAPSSFHAAGRHSPAEIATRRSSCDRNGRRFPRRASCRCRRQ